jgi:hypothetical protein
MVKTVCKSQQGHAKPSSRSSSKCESTIPKTENITFEDIQNLLQTPAYEPKPPRSDRWGCSEDRLITDGISMYTDVILEGGKITNSTGVLYQETLKHWHNKFLHTPNAEKRKVLELILKDLELGGCRFLEPVEAGSTSLCLVKKSGRILSHIQRQLKLLKVEKPNLTDDTNSKSTPTRTRKVRRSKSSQKILEKNQSSSPRVLPYLLPKPSLNNTVMKKSQAQELESPSNNTAKTHSEPDHAYHNTNFVSPETVPPPLFESYSSGFSSHSYFSRNKECTKNNYRTESSFSQDSPESVNEGHLQQSCSTERRVETDVCNGMPTATEAEEELLWWASQEGQKEAVPAPSLLPRLNNYVALPSNEKNWEIPSSWRHDELTSISPPTYGARSFPSYMVDTMVQDGTFDRNKNFDTGMAENNMDADMMHPSMMPTVQTTVNKAMVMNRSASRLTAGVPSASVPTMYYSPPSTTTSRTPVVDYTALTFKNASDMKRSSLSYRMGLLEKRVGALMKENEDLKHRISWVEQSSLVAALEWNEEDMQMKDKHNDVVKATQTASETTRESLDVAAHMW